MNWFIRLFIIAWVILGILTFVGVFVSTPFFAVITNVFNFVNVPVIFATVSSLIEDFKKKEE